MPHKLMTYLVICRYVGSWDIFSQIRLSQIIFRFDNPVVKGAETVYVSQL